MSVWENVKLGDVATIDRNSVNPHDLPGPTYYLGLEHIARGGEITNSSTVADAQLTSNKFQFDVRHLLYGKLRPNLAKVASPTESGVCSTDILPILPGERLNRRYLLHYLRQPSVVSYASSRASGANLPRLSPGALSSFAIPLPPIPEQRRIASILDEADALRSKRRAQLAHLDELPQALFHEIPREDITPTPLGTIASFVRGVTYKPTDVTDSGIGIMRTKNVQRDLDTSDVVRITPSRPIKPEKFLQHGDVLVSSANSWNLVGKCCFVGDLPEPFAIGGFVAALRPTPRVNPTYLYHWFNSEVIQQTVRSFGNQTTNIANLNFKRTEALPVPVPPKPVQEFFAERVSAIRAERDRVARALEADEELFAALQHRAFRGEL